MSMDWATTAVTVVTSSLASGFVTFLLNARQQERSVKREKLELLCGLLHKQHARFAGMTRLANQALAGPADLKAYQDFMAESARENDIAHEKVVALIAIYFPTLKPKFDAAARAGWAATGAAGMAKQVKQFEALTACHQGVYRAAIELGPTVNAPLWKFWK
ncbi:hypothetical protein [Dyella sp. EPa41]|uniref:hypothetical protein n=1 Tax=Dyella sp. EPa41 TaxID=1561194 RepID=UPI001915DCDE|nr:hypothetical protein [Dyella sp. EPa41]